MGLGRYLLRGHAWPIRRLARDDDTGSAIAAAIGTGMRDCVARQRALTWDDPSRSTVLAGTSKIARAWSLTCSAHGSGWVFGPGKRRPDRAVFKRDVCSNACGTASGGDPSAIRCRRCRSWRELLARVKSRRETVRSRARERRACVRSPLRAS